MSEFYLPLGLDINGGLNRVDTAGNFVDNPATDSLAKGINSEYNIITDATVKTNIWNRVVATNPIALVLPSAALNNGKFIGIVIDQSCTRFTTLQDAAGAYIDYNCINGTQVGQTSRKMWAGERAVLYSNGTYWHKINGVVVPLAARVTNTTAQLFNANVTTLITFDTVIGTAYYPADFVNPPTITIQRAGLYEVQLHLGFNYTNAVDTFVTAYIYKNGASIESIIGYSYANNFRAVCLKHTNYFSVGDTLQPYGRFSAGTYGTSVLGYGTQGNSFNVTEIPNW